MKPTTENTRELSNGDVLMATDFIVIPAAAGEGEEMIVVGDDNDGIVIDGTEFNQYRRFTRRPPIDELAEEYDIQTEMGREALLLALSNVALLDRKQRDYGPKNIASTGEFGVLVRLTDKLARMERLLTKSLDPKNESLLDTYTDISNYGLIAALVRSGKWR